ncbi:MAG: DNA-3-methyladenine glycosylase I [Acutalibacter sp.]|nr:DNA-3-methyladenine glycosylase I [Acutalibacter sp.]
MKKCAWCLDGGMMERYHDEEWGEPVHDDGKQFEYLMLEAMQCGLSWSLMLKKREIFRQCFDNFDFRKIAQYTETDVERILNTEGMIRSRGKVNAIINNAKCFLGIIEEYGSFDQYLWGFSGGKTMVYRKHQKGEYETRNELSDRIAKDMKKRGFKYLGSITLFSHLQACGIINDHDPGCFKYAELLEKTDVQYID